MYELTKSITEQANQYENPDSQEELEQLEPEYSLEENFETFNYLYEKFPASAIRTISRQERDQQGYLSTTLAYGEIGFFEMNDIFAKLIDHGFSSHHSVFIDLGAGSGKPVMSAALSGEFITCIGIEIMSGLHSICTSVQEKWAKLCYKRKWRVRMEIEVEFLCGDFLSMEWCKADVLFAHAACFDDGMMDHLDKLLEKLRPGSFCVILSKSLNSTCFSLLETFDIGTCWGIATGYLYQRNATEPVGEISDREFLHTLGI